MSKILIILTTILLTILAFYKNNVIENFGFGLQGTTYNVQDVIIPATKNQSAKLYSLPQNMAGIFGQNLANYPTIATRNLQGVVPSRIMPMGLGANINFNLPDYKNMAVDTKNPLMFNNHIDTGFSETNPEPKTKENYVPNCQKGGLNCNSNRENFGEKELSTLENKYSNLIGDEDVIASTLPTATGMTQFSQDMLGNNTNADQPIILDRMIVANITNRTYGEGCPLRGDIPIEPDVSGWFQTSIKPETGLRQGALSVMGGLNTLDFDKTAFMAARSGNYNQIAGGMQQNAKFGQQVLSNLYQQSMKNMNMAPNFSNNISDVPNGQAITSTIMP